MCLSGAGSQGRNVGADDVNSPTTLPRPAPSPSGSGSHLTFLPGGPSGLGSSPPSSPALPAGSTSSQLPRAAPPPRRAPCLSSFKLAAQQTLGRRGRGKRRPGLCKGERPPPHFHLKRRRKATFLLQLTLRGREGGGTAPDGAARPGGHRSGGRRRGAAGGNIKWPPGGRGAGGREVGPHESFMTRRRRV